MKTKENFTVGNTGAEQKSIFAALKTFSILGFITLYICGIEYFRFILNHFQRK